MEDNMKEFDAELQLIQEKLLKGMHFQDAVELLKIRERVVYTIALWKEGRIHGRQTV